MDSPAQLLPAWVRKRDGSTVAFEADKINRALFAAAENAGEPDAFVARELTDSVLHFLTAESDGSLISSSQIAETVIKVVRELGQAKIARAFAEFNRQRSPSFEGAAKTAARPAPEKAGQFPATYEIHEWIESGTAPAKVRRRSGAAALERYSLKQMYSRNLVAVHKEGLLLLDGLDSPLELAGVAVRPALSPARGGVPWTAPGIFEVIEQARQYASGVIALDAPERELAQREARIGEAAAYVRELGQAARTLDVEVVLNLGSETTPDWSEESVPGPLFAGRHKPEMPERIEGHLDALIDQLLQQRVRESLRLDWHLTHRDFADEDARKRVTRLAQAALRGAPVGFVCDRPHQPLSLAEGIDRRHLAILQWVGLHLPNLLERHAEKLSPDAYLAKLMSLAKLAASAGVQKRNFLRRHSRPERPTFVVDRAHVVFYLMGLPELLNRFFGADHGESESAEAFVLQMLRHLQETLAFEAKLLHLHFLVDEKPSGTDVAGERQSAVDWKTKISAAGRLHSVIGRGTVRLSLLDATVPEPAEFVELLHYSWSETAVNRIALVRSGERQRQLAAPWHQ